MNKRYYKITAKFRSELWVFLVKCKNQTEITDEVVCETVCQHFKATIGKSEISYTTTEITMPEYLVSGLDKFSSEDAEENSLHGFFLSKLLKSGLAK